METEQFPTNKGPSVVFLDQIEHQIMTLAQGFENLVWNLGQIEKTDLEAITRDDSYDPHVRRVAKGLRARLAQLIVKEYSRSKLPLIDDLILTRYVNKDLPTRLKSKTRFKLCKRNSRKWAKHVQQSREISSEFTPSAPDYQYDPGNEWPPKLPDIRNVELLDQVFTHRSILSQTELLEPTSMMLQHYERLEFKGDAVLEHVVADLIYFRFPEASPGTLTTYKSHLVCNNTIWEFAVLYKFDQRLRHNGSVSTLAEGKKTKTIADVFEAYLGALSISEGDTVVRKWLEPLYEPFLRELEKQNESRCVDMSAKADLYRKIGSADQKPVYKNMSATAPFTVHCMVGDTVIGVGCDASSTKIASQRAAMDALANKELIEELAAKRLATLRTAPVTGAAQMGQH